MATLGSLLIKAGAISRKQLNEAIQCQVIFGGSIGTNLIELGYIDEDTLARFLSMQISVPSATHEEADSAPKEVVALLTPELAEKYYAVPLRIEEGKLALGMADPNDIPALEMISSHTGLEIIPYIMPEFRLVYALEKYYNIKRDSRYVNLTRPAPERFYKGKSGASASPPPVGTEGRQGPRERFQRKYVSTTDDRHRGPTAPPENLSLADVEQLLDKVRDRDEIADVVFAYTKKRLRRVILFIVRSGMVLGWNGYGPNVTTSLVQSLMVPLTTSSIFKTVIDSQGHYLGGVTDVQVNRRFFKALGDTNPRTVLVLPVSIKGSIVTLLYGDNGEGKKVAPDISDLQLLAAKVSAAFERLIREIRDRKISPGPGSGK